MIETRLKGPHKMDRAQQVVILEVEIFLFI